MTKDKLVLKPAQADADCIRVQLDRRTIVLIKDLKKFAYWKERYPEACILDPLGTNKA